MIADRTLLLKDATVSARIALSGLLDILESGNDSPEVSLAQIERDLRDAADLVNKSIGGAEESEEFEIGERDD